MTDENKTTEPPAYRVIQKGRVTNIGVQDFDSLVTHHPDDNANAIVVNGVVINGQRDRRHAVVSGEIDEIAVGVRGGTNGLAAGQVLQKKDFILENPAIPSGGRGARDVDVPSPFAGYVGRAGGTMGTVDIYDREGGTLVARVLHLDPIHVTAGSTIEYGQALGVQNNKGLPNAGKHVHMEVDTRHYQAYGNYVGDLVSGRLSMDPARRTQGIEPRPVVDDGVIRIGETSERVRDVQQHLNQLGIRDANGRELPTDGVYRLSMQAAVIRFQQARGLPATGDLDAATLQSMPRVEHREPDRSDHTGPTMPPLGAPASAAPSAARAALESDPLHAQAKAAVQALDGSLGRTFDDASARMTASLACLARTNGFNRIDHIVLSEKTASVEQGGHVFVVQGRLDDAAHRVVHMRTDEAVNAPADQSARQFQELTATRRQTVHAPEPTPQQPTPRMTLA